MTRQQACIHFIAFSTLGIICFFVPIEIAGKSTILFDHAAGAIVKHLRSLSIFFLFLMMAYGLWQAWQQPAKQLSHYLLFAAKLLGLLLALLYLCGALPSVLMQKNMMPFLFEKLALPVAMIIPIGALALSFLVGFGLLEAIGVLMRPVMQPIFKTSGAAAIDAVASFVGSYSVGLLITNRIYQAGNYSLREAAIIATGFSTVSAAFMVIVAKTLDLMSHWNFFFWSSLFITFMVTAITARIPPISRLSSQKKQTETHLALRELPKAAFEAGVLKAQQVSDAKKLILSHGKEGVQMAAAVAPCLLSIGLLGLLLAQYTPLFDGLGAILYPVVKVVGVPEAFAAAKAIATGLAEMFLPALQLSQADLLTRYIAAVTSISSVLFFSGSIPCILSTRIPLSMLTMLLIWLERVVLSILLAGVFAHLFLR